MLGNANVKFKKSSRNEFIIAYNCINKYQLPFSNSHSGIMAFYLVDL